jgi:hypothetical protein
LAPLFVSVLPALRFAPASWDASARVTSLHGSSRVAAIPGLDVDELDEEELDDELDEELLSEPAPPPDEAELQAANTAAQPSDATRTG